MATPAPLDYDDLRQRLGGRLAHPTQPGTEILVTESINLILPLLDAHLHVARGRPDHIVLVVVETGAAAHVAESERVRPSHHPIILDGCRFHCVTLEYGFMDDLDVPQTLVDAWKRGELEYDPRDARYICGEADVRIDARSGAMSYWRRLLFGWMARRAGSLSEHLRLPVDRTLKIRIQLRL